MNFTNDVETKIKELVRNLTIKAYDEEIFGTPKFFVNKKFFDINTNLIMLWMYIKILFNFKSTLLH